MPGHFSQILGDSAEADFYALALDIGYNVIRRQNLSPGIDFIAEFRGRVFENATLLRPAFSPAGLTAFSIKAGDISQQDVQELGAYVSQCASSSDTLLKRVAGGVLVSGAIKTAGQVNAMRAQGVYCWDARRLIFYSVKAKKVAKNSELGPVNEHPLDGMNGGFVFTIHGMHARDVDAIADVFVDDHTFQIQGDHLTSILASIYRLAVLPTAQSMHRQVKLKLSLHALGPVMRTIVERAYDDYRNEPPRDLILHPVTDLELQSYATGPWTAIFRV